MKKELYTYKDNEMKVVLEFAFPVKNGKKQKQAFVALLKEALEDLEKELKQ